MKAVIEKIKTGKKAGQFIFKIYARNGNKIAKSYPESYTTKAKCKQTLRSCFPAFEVIDKS